jgi:hypothetical protein
MNKKILAQSLLRVLQSPAERVQFQASKTLTAFVEEIGIGIVQGKQIMFSAAHKRRICEWLRAENIDPATSPDAWADVNRAAALELGPDEKWAGLSVRANRIALKALRGRPLQLEGEAIYLPPRANLECDVHDALEGVRHDSVIVVENWEVFERVDDLKLDFQPAGENPLVLWRGSVHTSVGASLNFLIEYGRAVWSAPDYDPEGLAIASRLPHLEGVLAPPDDVLRDLLGKSKLQGRYEAQLPGAQATLDHAKQPDIRKLWAIVKTSRNALPQERLCNNSLPTGMSR